MSRENVEIVRRFVESWTELDLDGVLHCADADIEFDWSASRAPFRGTYTGHEGVRRWWAEHNDVWEEFRLEVVEVIECDDRRVITVNAVHARGRGSGISIEGSAAVLWRLDGSKVLGVRLFQSREEALEAVGMSEEDAHADS